MNLPDIYALCRQIISENEKFVQLFKDGKTGPLIGTAVKKSEGTEPAVVAEVLGKLIADPTAQPDPDWEKKEKEAAEKQMVEMHLERIEREGFRRGALFAYEQVMHILEADREVRASRIWPMGEMYETIWSNVFIHVNPAIKAFKS